MNRPARVAVFVSGSGTNLQALIDHFNGRNSPIARVELVVANREGVGGLARARAAGVSARVIEPGNLSAEELASETTAVLDEHGIDVVVLAGYLKLVPAVVVARYEGRMINIHPALLPSFGGRGMYGRRVHEVVLASGARVSGATVHLVNPRYDEGRIVAQWPVPVLPGDTPDTLAARVLRVEHILLPAAVESIVRGEPVGDGPPAGSFELIDAVAPDAGSVRRLVY